MSYLARRSRIPVAKEGVPLIFLSAFIAFITAILHVVSVTFLFVVITILMVNFFGDPDRIVPEGENLIVSPADGRVVSIKEVIENEFLERKTIRISIFMTIFDVHVNRVPCEGKVSKVKHSQGKFWAAQRERASLENEKNAVLLDRDDKKQILVVQVAGFIARRIRCWARPGDFVRRGERFGMIQFGSRLDVYLPLNSELMVKCGQKVRAGESVLCRLV